jgi:short-subunit dehydrogenase
MANGIHLKPIEEQVIVITGASSGIGLATALRAARARAKVVVAARSEETLRDLVRRIEGIGGNATYVTTDVSKREQVEHLASAAFEAHGRIDTWINDAGVSIYGRLDEVSEEDSRCLFDTNFWGVVNGSLVALPYLRRAGGALINVGSELSDAVIPLQGMYSASKHAVKGFTDALRVEVTEVDGANVSITLIQPTAVDTPYPEHARNYMSREPKLPSPRLDPETVAEAILDAAVNPRRNVRVGAMAVVQSVLAKVAPRIADSLSAKQVLQQQRAEPPRNPEGTLRTPGESGRMHGRNDESGAPTPTASAK